MSDKETESIKNLTTSFEEMFETAQAVKGEHFTELVGMMVNASSLVKVIGIAVSDSLEAGEYVLADPNNPIRKTITRILHQNLSMFASAAVIKADSESTVHLPPIPSGTKNESHLYCIIDMYCYIYYFIWYNLIC